MVVSPSILAEKCRDRSNPKLSLREPQIPKPEYQNIFGIKQDDYQRRVGELNPRAIQPTDDKLDATMNALDHVKSWKNTAKDLVDRLKKSRSAAEFDYRKVSETYEMTRLDEERGRLPEREVIAIDQRFQTLEGQIQVATSKVVDIAEKLKLWKTSRTGNLKSLTD